ncbi:hypothetical protein [Legionella fallonii]|uniref:Ankyrin repeats (3 copies) n=1 Tax=Legionella fallonii LLAP-10 TaxID=1212491 RepID=A0A098G0L2_9GAMM|nr:hypothetical protein [Legionella fallonii]CEG56003.1 conserved protein of unknown function [Legionella fallonii LLAP-10]
MNSNLFNKHFFDLSLHQDPNNFPTIYNEAPVYFVAVSEQDTNTQLVEFRQSSAFPLFKTQFELLLTKIDEWCFNHNIQEIFPQRNNLSAISIFKENLFAENRHFDIGEAVLFNQGKKALEELFLLIENNQISVDGKKNVLSNLQKGIVVCVGGVLTNVVDAKDDLKAHTGINEILYKIKVTFIQQIAITEIRQRYGNTAGNEIHYVNAYYNSVAKDYRLKQKEDNFIHYALKNINSIDLEEFKKTLNERFTPKIVFNNLIDKLKEDWNTLYNALLKDLDNNPRIQSSESEKLSRLFFYQEQWNQKYAALFELSIYDLGNAQDDGDFILHDLMILNSTLIPKVIKYFSERYLNQARKRLLPINDNAYISYCDELLWCENQGNPELVTLEIMQQIDKESLSPEAMINYCYVMEQLLVEYPNAKEQLLHLLNPLSDEFSRIILEHMLLTLIFFIEKNDLARGLKERFYSDTNRLHQLISAYPDVILNYLFELKNAHHFQDPAFINDVLDEMYDNEDAGEATTLLWYLVHYGMWSSVDLLIQNQSITIKQLTIAPVNGVYQGVNTLRLLADMQQWHLIKKLLSLKLITSEQLDSISQQGKYKKMPVLWLFACCNQWEIIKELIQQNLITSMQLSFLIEGMNLLWIFANYSQWEIIQTLINKNLVSAEHLLSKPQEGPNQGKNILWFLAANQKWQLFDDFLNHFVITAEQLSSLAEQGEDKGINIPWLLVRYGQWRLFKKLLEQRLITSEQLLPVPQQREFQGKNVLWLLVLQFKWEFITELLKQKRITSEHLHFTLQEGKNKGLPITWCLAAHPRQWSIFEELVRQKLITSEQLSFAPQEGPNKGANALWLLAYRCRWEIIAELVQQKLITSQHLSSMLHEGDKQGINVLCFLAYHRQWRTIEKLLHQKLITSEQLSCLPPKGAEQNVNVLLSLACHHQWSLIKELLQQKLITSEQLSSTFSDGPSQGKNVLWLLARHQQWEIIKDLLHQKLITSEHLYSSPKKQTSLLSYFIISKREKDEGKNVLSFLAAHHQKHIFNELSKQNLINKEQLSSLCPPKDKKEKKFKHGLFKDQAQQQKENTQNTSHKRPGTKDRAPLKKRALVYNLN